MDKSHTIINTEKETRSFFWFMTVIMFGLSAWLVISIPELRQPKRLIPFCICMIVFVLLYWYLRKVANNPGWTVGYMLVQGLLMVGMIVIVPNLGLTLGLSMALVGEAIGVYGVTKRGFLTSLFYLLLSLGVFVWLSGTEQIGWWLIGLVPMILFVVIYVEMYSRQAKANDRAQDLLKELESANRQLTEYAAKVEDLTIAAERQRMARELHDTLAQGLVGLTLQLEAAEANLLNGKNDRAREIIQTTMKNARTALANARLAIDDLRHNQPSNFEETLKNTIRNFLSETGISCDLYTNLPENLTTPITDTVTRIATEAFTNIARHAKATLVSMRAVIEENNLVFEMIDNGCGFDPSAIPVAGHYGIIGMEERVKLAGGSFKLTSQPGQGTTINVRIPLP